MKKRFKFVLLAACALFVVSATTAAAQKGLQLVVKGHESNISDIRLIDSKSYVPVREFAGLFHMGVGFDNATSEIALSPVDYDQLPEALRDYLVGWETLDAAKTAGAFAADGKFDDLSNKEGYQGAAIQAYLSGTFDYFKTLPGYKIETLQVSPLINDKYIGIWQLSVGGQVISEGSSFYKLENGKMKSAQVLPFEKVKPSKQ